MQYRSIQFISSQSLIKYIWIQNYREIDQLLFQCLFERDSIQAINSTKSSQQKDGEIIYYPFRYNFKINLCHV